MFKFIKSVTKILSKVFKKTHTCSIGFNPLLPVWEQPGFLHVVSTDGSVDVIGFSILNPKIGSKITRRYVREITAQAIKCGYKPISVTIKSNQYPIIYK